MGANALKSDSNEFQSESTLYSLRERQGTLRWMLASYLTFKRQQRYLNLQLLSA